MKLDLSTFNAVNALHLQTIKNKIRKQDVKPGGVVQTLSSVHDGKASPSCMKGDRPYPLKLWTTTLAEFRSGMGQPSRRTMIHACEIVDLQMLPCCQHQWRKKRKVKESRSRKTSRSSPEG